MSVLCAKCDHAVCRMLRLQIFSAWSTQSIFDAAFGDFLSCRHQKGSSSETQLYLAQNFVWTVAEISIPDKKNTDAQIKHVLGLCLPNDNTILITALQLHCALICSFLWLAPELCVVL